MIAKFGKTLLFITLATMLNSALAMNMLGRLGVGTSQQSYTQMNTLSLKLQRDRSTAMGGYFGIESESGTSLYALGAKFYKIIYDEPQLNFYNVFGLGMFTYEDSESDSTKSGYELEGGFGTEFSFQGLESIGFSFEFGVGLYNAGGDSIFKTYGHSILKSAVHFYL